MSALPMDQGGLLGDPMVTDYALPEEERRRIALTQLLFGLGAGIGGARRGQELGGLAQGGALGANMGQKAIMDATRERGATLTQALQGATLKRNATLYEQMMGALNGGGTSAGPPAAFQQPGGAAAQFGAAIGGDQLPTRDLPTQAPVGPDRDKLVNLNLASVASGGKDMSAAIKMKFPDIIPLRAGAGAYDPATQRVTPNPVAPPGYYYDNQQNAFVKVSNGAQAEAAAAAIPKAVNMAFEQPNAQKSDTGETFIPPGSRLQQQFGNGPLPYNAPTPFMTQGGAGGVPQPPQGVRTDIGPTAHTELGKRGDTYADQASAIDTAAAAAQQTNARNKEMRGLVDQFTPGAASPFRRNVGSWLEAAGAPKEWVTKAAGGDLGAMQALQKQVVNAAFEATKQLTNRPAAAEVIMAATKGSPNEMMTKPAITAILDYNDGVTRWLTEKQQAKEAWIAPQSGHGGSLAGFEPAWNRERPLDGYIPSVEHLQGVFGSKGSSESQPPRVNMDRAPTDKEAAYIAREGGPQLGNGPLTKNVTALYKARQAIKAGADRTAVAARLQQQGFSPEGL